MNDPDLMLVADAFNAIQDNYKAFVCSVDDKKSLFVYQDDDFVCWFSSDMYMDDSVSEVVNRIYTSVIYANSIMKNNNIGRSTKIDKAVNGEKYISFTARSKYHEDYIRLFYVLRHMIDGYLNGEETVYWRIYPTYKQSDDGFVWRARLVAE